MPTRFWLKKIGNPSSSNIAIATKIKKGEKRMNRMSAENLLSISISI